MSSFDKYLRFSWKFAVKDLQGNRVGEVSKRWEGLRGVFHAEDRYVVRLNPGAPDPGAPRLRDRGCFRGRCDSRHPAIEEVAGQTGGHV